MPTHYSELEVLKLCAKSASQKKPCKFYKCALTEFKSCKYVIGFDLTTLQVNSWYIVSYFRHVSHKMTCPFVDCSLIYADCF